MKKNIVFSVRLTMFNKIPFNKPVYFKTLMCVSVGFAELFVVAISMFDYELTKADPLRAPMAAVMLSYIIHLGIWNSEE